MYAALHLTTQSAAAAALTPSAPICFTVPLTLVVAVCVLLDCRQNLASSASASTRHAHLLPPGAILNTADIINSSPTHDGPMWMPERVPDIEAAAAMNRIQLSEPSRRTRRGIVGAQFGEYFWRRRQRSAPVVSSNCGRSRDCVIGGSIGTGDKNRRSLNIFGAGGHSGSGVASMAAILYSVADRKFVEIGKNRVPRTTGDQNSPDAIIRVKFWCSMVTSPMYPCPTELHRHSSANMDTGSSSTVPVYSLILLQFARTQRYLCLHKTGKLVTQADTIDSKMADCVWRHEIALHKNDVYYSWKYPSTNTRNHDCISKRWYLGVSPTGNDLRIYRSTVETCSRVPGSNRTQAVFPVVRQQTLFIQRWVTLPLSWSDVQHRYESDVIVERVTSSKRLTRYPTAATTTISTGSEALKSRRVSGRGGRRRTRRHNDHYDADDDDDDYDNDDYNDDVDDGSKKERDATTKRASGRKRKYERMTSSSDSDVRIRCRNQMETDRRRVPADVGHPMIVVDIDNAIRRNT